jgi:hypothetical protein
MKTRAAILVGLLRLVPGELRLMSNLVAAEAELAGARG